MADADATASLTYVTDRHRRAVTRQTKALSDDMAVLSKRLEQGAIAASDARAILGDVALLIERLAALEALEEVAEEKT